MEECPRLSIFNYSSNTVLNEWYITNQCGASWPRLMLYGINLVIFLISVLAGIYLIPYNLKHNKKWLSAQLSRPIITAFITNFVYLWIYVAALVGTPGSDTFLIIGWWLAINAGNAFQLAAAYAWITPIRHLKNLNSATNTVITSVLDTLSNIQYIIFFTSIAFNIGIVAAHVVYYQRGDAYRVWLLHTFFHVGTLIVTGTFVRLFNWACTKLRGVLIQNFEELGSAMRGPSQLKATAAVASATGDDTHAGKTSGVTTASESVGGASTNNNKNTLGRSNNTQDGKEGTGNANTGGNVQKQQIEAIISLLDHSIKISSVSGYISGSIQLAILIWVIAVRTPEGMAGVNYIYSIRSLSVALSTCKVIYMYGYVKVRDDLAIKQQSKGGTA
ncbi:hypothetical protein HDU85_004023 [Gaertneriomyces sp. JEL0708]|nr:hypothetical protein HDU85_004023 [Gaertneriomyces sp. JEL0708]